MLGKMTRLRDSVVFKFIHCICHKAELFNISSKLEQAQVILEVRVQVAFFCEAVG